MSLNSVNITGNLVSDASVHDSSNGTAYVKFSIAVNDRAYDNRTGSWTTYTSYLDCVMFGARVPRLSSELVRGRKVSLKGRLRQNRWVKDGKKLRRVEIVVEDLELMSFLENDAMPDDDLAEEDFVF